MIYIIEWYWLIDMARKVTPKTDEQLVESAKKLAQQRKRAVQNYEKKIIEDGGLRFSIILEEEYAKPFHELTEQHGSRKKAFVFLLNEHLKRSS